MEAQSNKTYIAITFGPISRVASYAKDTKGIWASSYLFSYIAKKVIEPFKDNEGKRTFLLPALNEEMNNPAIIQGAGVYPDRYVLESQAGDFNRLCKSVQGMYTDLAEKISQVINEDEGKIEAYLKRTIKVYAFEKSIETDKDVVKSCEDLLAYMECQDIYPQKDPVNYLQLFFEKVKDSFLVDDGFGKKYRDRLFESIIEYSAVEFNTDEFWSGIQEKILRFNSKALIKESKLAAVEKEGILKPYHKYIVFVKADGDNMTDTIKGLKANRSSAMTLSNALFEYNKETINIISGYGGRTLFLGGDDLLFFAPVRNGKKTIFTLLSEIEEKFEKVLRKWIPNLKIPLPTLSFGVSISYYKHPMFEAYQKAEDLLNWAKSDMDGTIKDNKKNRIAWNLRKHSGQVYKSVVFKEFAEFYDKFKDLTTRRVFELSHKEDYLSSFTYWLEQNRFQLEYILNKLPKSGDEKMVNDVNAMLENYLNNSFDEPVHDNEGMNSYKKVLVEYLVEHKKSHGNDADAISSLYATLRFVGFLISDKNDE